MHTCLYAIDAFLYSWQGEWFRYRTLRGGDYDFDYVEQRLRWCCAHRGLPILETSNLKSCIYAVFRCLIEGLATHVNAYFLWNIVWQITMMYANWLPSKQYLEMRTIMEPNNLAQKIQGPGANEQYHSTEIIHSLYSTNHAENFFAP